MARGLRRGCLLESDVSSRASASFSRGIPGGGKLGGRVCRTRGGGEVSFTRTWFLSVQSTLLLGTRVLGCGGAWPQARRLRCGAGDVPGPVLTKGAPLHLLGGAAPEKWSLAAGLSPGEVFLGCRFISIIAFFF